MTNIQNECTKLVDSICKEVTDLYTGTDDDAFMEYITDVLDVEYTLSSTLNLIGVRLYLTLGGPTVYIDIKHGSGTVEARWGEGSATAYLWGSVSNAILDSYAEYYDAERRI